MLWIRPVTGVQESTIRKVERLAMIKQVPREFPGHLLFGYLFSSLEMAV